ALEGRDTRSAGRACALPLLAPRRGLPLHGPRAHADCSDGSAATGAAHHARQCGRAGRHGARSGGSSARRGGRAVRQARGPAAHLRFLFLRLVEDYLFMARVRTQIAVTDLPPLGLPITLGSVGEQAGTVRDLVEAQLGAAAGLSDTRFARQRIGAGDTAIVLE